MSRIRQRAIAPIVIGVVGTAILVSLGVWQVQRLAWKEGLIAELEARMEADRIPLPARPDPETDKLVYVSAEGRLRGEELHILTSVKPHGPGYRLVVPMDVVTPGAASTHQSIMVDLGYVPERMKDPALRADRYASEASHTAMSIEGRLHWPNEIDWFTPGPDLGRNIWFARDVEAMAAELGTDPVLLIAERHPLDDIVLPRPPGIDLPNRHLEYAVTWFGLALVWVLMSLVWLRSERRKSRN
ncbi:MAG: SURF1 family protein [Pseudomonadota bacterium]